jgi:hypothetical protein
VWVVWFDLNDGGRHIKVRIEGHGQATILGYENILKPRASGGAGIGVRRRLPRNFDAREWVNSKFFGKLATAKPQRKPALPKLIPPPPPVKVTVYEKPYGKEEPKPSKPVVVTVYEKPYPKPFK